ncbi:MAG TPA: hypothetical protein P5157_04685 [Paludibacteraceae bacterium]|jgi:hypothetical protein|nr:hypothetical protein [Paludibacteraceae bacterium]OPZ03253.1 MAG: hypothetical protein BWZ11_00224 [Bacteroidetes bacterium ADurb.BinA395]MBP8966939.1 hypothetical protein [Paludibacteraceae bacterium]HOF98800.1 hypothetical protein [Paludibacteraceae bacterium]HOJ66333.1 hypothetical protein [Paludibacteraceae bacterium]
MTPSFFNIYKPRKYDYRYIYYDPLKEAIKEREKQMAKENGEQPQQEYKPNLHRGSFREEANRMRGKKSKELRRSNRNVLIILIILLIIAYYLLK